MATGAGRPRAARRPGRTVLATVLGVLLVLGGGTALVAGVTGRDAAAPPAVPEGGVTAAPTAPATPADSPATAGGPQGRALAAPPSPAAGATTGPSTAPTTEPTTGATAEPAPAPVAEPVSVRIPSVGISSELLHLGLQDDGRLQVPEGPDFDTAAWFDGSPRPGEVGPAVLLGHVSSRARGPSVFHDLARLRPGDRVEVERSDGTTATFEVYGLQQFPKDAFPTLQVYGNTDGPELRLITCGGTIAESTGRFEDNVVVFARQV